MLDKRSIYTKCMYNCLVSWKSRITTRRKMCIYHVANILPCDKTFWVLLRIKRGIMFITPSFTRMVQVGKQSKFINWFGMLLHAFPSMFVCSPCEFPENCADNMSMILKVLKEVHLLDLYAKTIHFLFYYYVFNSCQKWLNILIQSVISSVEVYDKHIITCHFSYHTLYQSSFIYSCIMPWAYMWWLIFYSHVESTCMTASFHSERRFGPQTYFNPTTFYWSTFTKPGKWGHICVR